MKLVLQSQTVLLHITSGNSNKLLDLLFFLYISTSSMAVVQDKVLIARSKHVYTRTRNALDVHHVAFRAIKNLFLRMREQRHGDKKRREVSNVNCSVGNDQYKIAFFICK